MEASALAPAAPAETQPERRETPVAAFVREIGDMAAFALHTLRELRGVWHYTAEVLRQAGILITGSALVIFGMTFIIGAECGLFGTYFTRSFGASGLIGFFTAHCGIREVVPYMFGYIFAAKVGCGLVAEIGSMRISEEIEALEATGVDPIRYLVATRLVAMWICFPFIYVFGIVTASAGAFASVVLSLHEVSPGGWARAHWFHLPPQDILYSHVKAFTMATTIALVGMFYGYRARGGPVGVGAATARSMVANLILVHVIGSVYSLIFFGGNPRLPFGG